MLEEGKKAPALDLPADGGRRVTLSDLKGRPVIVYFYPKDDTSGCTAEAQAFSAKLAEFKALGAEVIGVSPDSVASHDKFRDKYGLSVTLASDESHKTLKAWGVWVEKSMYGRKYMGVERSTFLIDTKGTVARVWRKVKVPKHADEVLEALKELK
jgi:peroxiredoxin Q/BCP